MDYSEAKKLCQHSKFYKFSKNANTAIVQWESILLIVFHLNGQTWAFNSPSYILQLSFKE